MDDKNATAIADNFQRVSDVFTKTLGLIDEKIVELLTNRLIYGATVGQCQALIVPPVEGAAAQAALDRLIQRNVVVVLNLPGHRPVYFHRSHAGKAEHRRKALLASEAL